ncbi:MAG: metal ABC transporter permease [Syntrophomonadaceae bacterium]|nr:metal ABC transporter permease [Syntrophomonadaceae bacterium]
MPEIFQYGFMLRAMAAGLVVGAVSPAIGLFLVVKRLSLLGEGLSHAAFTGVAIGWLLGAEPLLTAVLFSALVAVGIEKLRARRAAQGDIALAIMLYASLALGLVIMSRSMGLGTEAMGYLFGSIMTVTSFDLIMMLAIGLFVMGTIALFHKELFAVALDEEAARVSGIPVERLNLLLVVLTAMTVTAAMRVVGTLLVAALLVIPVATALQLNRGFWVSLAYSVGFAIIAVFLGLVISFYLDLPPGGAIVLTAVSLFLSVLAAKKFLRIPFLRCQGRN